MPVARKEREDGNDPGSEDAEKPLSLPRRGVCLTRDSCWRGEVKVIPSQLRKIDQCVNNARFSNSSSCKSRQFYY